MHVLEAQQQTTPSFSGTHRFKVDSPVVVRKRREDGSRAYLTYEDAAADARMTRTLRFKMKRAGLDASHHDVTVAFDRSYEGARTKLTTIEKGGPAIKHKGSICPVIVDGTPKAVQFAWTVGIGELTGSGFGALQ
jgi:CRISPR-associated endoribonuclease Cas6